jgi:hypothetical protein
MRQPRGGQYYNLSGGDPEDCMVRSLPSGLGAGAPFVSSPKDPGRCSGITTLWSLGSGPRALAHPKGNGAIECSTIVSKACERPAGRSSGARRQPNKTGQARLRHPGGGTETGGRRLAATASIKARKLTSKNFLARSHLRRFPFGDDRLVVFVFFSSILDRIGQLTRL